MLMLFRKLQSHHSANLLMAVAASLVTASCIPWYGAIYTPDDPKISTRSGRGCAGPFLVVDLLVTPEATVSMTTDALREIYHLGVEVRTGSSVRLTKPFRIYDLDDKKWKTFALSHRENFRTGPARPDEELQGPTRADYLVSDSGWVGRMDARHISVFLEGVIINGVEIPPREIRLTAQRTVTIESICP